MLQITGNITAELDDQQMVFSGEGNELKLEIDHPGPLLKSLNAGRSQRNASVRKLAQELQQQDVTVRVLSQGKTLAVLGSKAKAGVVSRLLRLPYLELKLNWQVLKLLMG